MTRRMKVYMTVTVPDGVHAAAVKQHVKDAFERWGGEHGRDYPLYPSPELEMLDARVVVDETRWFRDHPSRRAG